MKNGPSEELDGRKDGIVKLSYRRELVAERVRGLNESRSQGV